MIYGIKKNLILKLNLWKKTIIYLLIVIIHHSIYIKIIRFIQKQLNQKNIFNLNLFIKDTSIATSSMIIKELIQQSKFKKNSYNEDYDFKCKILQKV